MSCPYFCPEASVGAPGSSAILPLGEEWNGVCCAAPVSSEPPPSIRRRCNFGYARDECSSFPSGSGPDAVRFTIRAADPASIRLYYVVERDHHPFAHGPLEYSVLQKRVITAGPAELLARQAEAYAQSYLRRKETRQP